MGSDMRKRPRKANRSSASELFRQGRYDEARQLAENLLAIDPKHLGALEVRAQLQWRTGEIAELIATLDRLVELNPYEPGYYSLRGAAFQSCGRCGDAIRAYERCVSLGGPATGDVSDQMEALKAWQSELIHDLLESDRVFAAAFAQNPQAACDERGFAYARATRTAVVQAIERATLSARPS